jgi:multidrug resistance efflux pump
MTLRISPPDGDGKVDTPPIPFEQSDRRPNRHWPRRMILGLVALATLCVCLFGYSWFSYRLEHTVIHNASVKGRVHRIGSRLDGQVKSVEVEPGQRVARDQVLIRLEDAHYCPVFSIDDTA